LVEQRIVRSQRLEHRSAMLTTVAPTRQAGSKLRTLRESIPALAGA
jgi:hypothetical protein